jgi:hypothetical protein
MSSHNVHFDWTERLILTSLAVAARSGAVLCVDAEQTMDLNKLGNPSETVCDL